MENIQKAISKAQQFAAEGDHEMAHGFEKRAWALALHAIAEGADNAPELAKLALSTRDIDFARWFS